MLPVVCIVGRPNVGKSSLFNRIIGQRISITDDTPGVTRDRIYAKGSWLQKEFVLIDTGGIEISDVPFKEEIKAQAELAIEKADVIIMLCDGRGNITSEDEYVARMLQKTEKPVILALNKVDNNKYADNQYDYYSLGLGTPICISCAHGIGVGDLLDEVVKYFKSDASEVDDQQIAFSFIGRPNVGKSSLTNAILGEERVIVSDIEGTTRDTIDTLFKRNNKLYQVIDTAGMKKKNKLIEKAEKYSLLRALEAIERSDVCLVVIDGSYGIHDFDKRVAGYAKEANKAIVFVVNKWDIVEKHNTIQQEWIDNIREEFKFVSYAMIVFTSALTKKRLHTLFLAIDKAYDNYTKRFKTYLINDVIMDALQMNPTPNFNGGRLKIYYVTQVSIKPPTFVLFCNNTEYAHFSYMRYLENTLRKAFDFEGTPIKLLLRKRE